MILATGQRCPERASDVDHLVAMLDDNRIEALTSMCRQHHARKSASEGGQAAASLRRSIAAKKVRPAQPHPGLRSAP